MSMPIWNALMEAIESREESSSDSEKREFCGTYVKISDVLTAPPQTKESIEQAEQALTKLISDKTH